MTRSHGAAALLAIAAALASLPAGAAPQLFKCIEGGRTVYQQQACPVTSQPESMASGASAITGAGGIAGAKAASEPATRLAARVKPASPAASSAPATPR